MNLRNHRFLVVFASMAVLALTLGVTGCSDDDDGTPTEPKPENAQVRVQHLFPGAGGVDVYATPLATLAYDTPITTTDQETAADSIKVFENVDYLESSSFAEVPPGSYKIDVTLTGDPIGDAVLTIPSIDFAKNVAYTAVAWDDGSGIAALPLVDNLGNPGAGSLRVRAVHVANTIGQVDIWLVTDPTMPIPLWTDLDTGTAGADIIVPAEAATLGIDVDDDSLVDVFFEVPLLPAGTIINAYASIDGSGDLFFIAQTQDGTTVPVTPAETGLRLVHGSPSAGAVDVYANAAVQLAQNFQFTDGTSSTTVASATYDIQLTTVGGDPQSPLLKVADVTLRPGDQTVVAYDDGTAKLLVADDDLFAPAAGKFRVRAIHTADGIDQVDIWETDTPTPLWVDLDRGAIGDYLELDAGQYNIGIDTDNDATTDVNFTLPSIAAGEVLNVLAINDGGTVFLLAQLLDGSTARIDAD